jgi:predicted Zn-dependent protease
LGEFSRGDYSQPASAKEMNKAEIYATAVHEIGHILGLKHNESSRSVMYFLNVNGTAVLDGKDIRELSRRHKLRPEVLEKSLLPIQAGSLQNYVP